MAVLDRLSGIQRVHALNFSYTKRPKRFCIWRINSVKDNIFWKIGAFKTGHRFILSLKIANYPSV
jgi:hypothetical protein